MPDNSITSALANRFLRAGTRGSVDGLGLILFVITFIVWRRLEVHDYASGEERGSTLMATRDMQEHRAARGIRHKIQAARRRMKEPYHFNALNGDDGIWPVHRLIWILMSTIRA